LGVGGTLDALDFELGLVEVVIIIVNTYSVSFILSFNVQEYPRLTRGFFSVTVLGNVFTCSRSELRFSVRYLYILLGSLKFCHCDLVFMIALPLQIVINSFSNIV
jgi:uncharacterized membrane protein